MLAFPVWARKWAIHPRWWFCPEGVEVLCPGVVVVIRTHIIVNSIRAIIHSICNPTYQKGWFQNIVTYICINNHWPISSSTPIPLFIPFQDNYNNIIIMETFHFAANHSSISYWWLHAHYAMLATAMFFIALDGDYVWSTTPGHTPIHPWTVLGLIFNSWTPSFPPLDSIKLWSHSNPPLDSDYIWSKFNPRTHSHQPLARQ